MTTIYVQNKDDLPERHPNDLYRTERNIIRAVLKPLSVNMPDGISILDIGAGDGRWGLVAREFWPEAELTGVDIDDIPNPGFDHWYPSQSFLDDNFKLDNYQLILSNPPYYIAEKIIRKALTLLDDYGHMLFLLRLAFQSGVGRYNGLWTTHYPFKVSVCVRRPSFYKSERIIDGELKKSSTNGTDYGIYWWHKINGHLHGLPRTWHTDLLYYERDTEQSNG